jgi:hypothetical protein
MKKTARCCLMTWLLASWPQAARSDSPEENAGLRGLTSFHFADGRVRIKLSSILLAKF